MNKLCIGKIVRPRGLAGEMKVVPETKISAVFDNIKRVYIDGEEFAVVRFNFRLGFAYLKLEGINRIEDAESFRNKSVWVTRDTFDNLDEDTFLISDLVSMSVKDELGEVFGRVEAVENYGSADVVVVRSDGRSYSVPFIKTVFLKIDIKRGIITVSKVQFNANKVT